MKVPDFREGLQAPVRVQGTDSLSLEDEASPRLPPPLNDERGTVYRTHHRSMPPVLFHRH